MICTIVLLVLLVGNCGYECAKHGQMTEEKHNMYSSLVATLITLALFYGTGMFHSLGL